MFHIFDDVILLSLGRTIFCGSLSGAKTFFADQSLPCKEDYNPADHYIWETSVDKENSEYSENKIINLGNSFKNSIYQNEISKSIKELTINKADDSLIDHKYHGPSIGVQE